MQNGLIESDTKPDRRQERMLAGFTPAGVPTLPGRVARRRLNGIREVKMTQRQFDHPALRPGSGQALRHRYLRQAQSAFTLIELLVVIAIIALLLSILTPSISQAKRLAERAVCASNMRGVGIGMAVYQSENNEYFVHTSGLWGLLERDDADVVRPGYIDAGSLVCPTARREKLVFDSYEWPGNVAVESSYWYFWQFPFAGGKADTMSNSEANAEWGDYHNRPATKISEVVSPGSAIFAAEGAHRREAWQFWGRVCGYYVGNPYRGGSEWCRPGDASTSENDIFWYHQMNQNFLHVDGHVELKPYSWAFPRDPALNPNYDDARWRMHFQLREPEDMPE